MREMKTISLIAVIAIVEALQLLAVIAHIYSFVPIHWNVPIPPGLEPERESVLYVIFLGLSVLISVLLIRFLYVPLQSQAFEQRCRKFLAFEMLWLGLMLFAFFKWITYRYPFYNILALENNRWVMPLFYSVTGLSFLSKVFWPEVDAMTTKVGKLWSNIVLPASSVIWIYLAMISFIGVVLYPNAALTTQIIASWSNFTHWQNFGVTHFLMTRGFSTESIVFMLYGFHAVILTALFTAAHWYLKNCWLAAVVVTVIMQMTLFHYGMSPVCWNYPQNTLINVGVNFTFFQDPAHPPMFMALRVRQFLSFLMGYGIILLYVFSLLNAWGKDKITVALSIVGMLTYTRYIASPDVFAFGAVCAPAVFLIGMWIRTLTEQFFPSKDKVIYASIMLVAIFLLLTNRVFVTYPHFWVTYVR